MDERYVGANRSETRHSLIRWLTDGPAVAFLEGPPGIGKTTLATDICKLAISMKSFKAIGWREVQDTEKPALRETLSEIAGLLSAAGTTAMSESLEKSGNTNASSVLTDALRQPILIVFDEAQRFLDRHTQSADEEFAKTLSDLRQRPELRGRLLLISNRRFPKEELWAEWILPHTLTKLNASEALELFQKRLLEKGIRVGIGVERIEKILSDLDHNPRAIQTLVGTLVEWSLDEIIQEAPDLWGTADRVVSRDFLEILERNLLEKTLSRIEPTHLRLIRMLSVHRRGVKRPALDAVCGGKDAGKQVVRILTNRFLANLSGALSFNPIVREICLERLREDRNEENEAHRAAAAFYERKFKAKDMVGHDRELGVDFAELRYHLFHSGRLALLGTVARKFISRITDIAKKGPPESPDELDERIGLLLSLQDSDRPSELEFHLAQCLQARGASGDAEKALDHIKEAIGPYCQAQVLQLLTELTRALHGGEAALSVLKPALEQWKFTEASLYLMGAECAETTGDRRAAVTFLREGILRVGPNSSAASLYHRAGRLLAEDRKYEEAVELVAEGIRCLPPGGAIAMLYQLEAQLLTQLRRSPEALDILRTGISAVPTSSSSALYLNLAELLADLGSQVEAVEVLRRGMSLGQPDLGARGAEILAKLGHDEDAITLLKESIAKVPGSQSLYLAGAEILAKIGRGDEAITLLKEGIVDVLPSQGLFSLYQAGAELLAKIDRNEEAITLLKEGITKIPRSSPLYQAGAEILVKIGRSEEAIGLLKEGMANVPPSQNLFSLYQAGTEILAKLDRKEEAITLVKAGITRIGPSQSLAPLYQIGAAMLIRTNRTNEIMPFLIEGIRKVPDAYEGNRIIESALYCAAAIGDLDILDNLETKLNGRVIDERQKILGEVLALQRRGEWRQAAARAASGGDKYPTYVHFATQEAFSWFCAHETSRAEAALRRFPNESYPNEWLRCNFELAHGDHERAERFIEAHLGHFHVASTEAMRFLMTQIWARDKERVGGLNLSYYFPILPSSVFAFDKPLDPPANGDALPEHDQDATRNLNKHRLEENIRSKLSEAYFARQLNDSAYQASFENAGMDKAKSALDGFFKKVLKENQVRYAYVSIGGADGSEIAWAMNNSPIMRGILLEYGTGAAAGARKRIDGLSAVGKLLVVLEGDAMQKLGEVSKQLSEWKERDEIDGIIVSAQSVLHELPYRSPSFNLSAFLGQLFKNWDSIFFCSREPCAPQGWPPVVQMKLKNVRGDTLAAIAHHIKAHLNFSGRIHSVANDFVEMPSDLALETLFKVLYLDHTFTYEMDERLTAFDPEQVAKILEDYLGPNSVKIEYTVSDHFDREYQRVVDRVINAETRNSVRMPNSFARIVAARHTA